MPEWLNLYAEAYRKVAENYEQLLPLQNGEGEAAGQWYGKVNK